MQHRCAVGPNLQSTDCKIHQIKSTPPRPPLNPNRRPQQQRQCLAVKQTQVQSVETLVAASAEALYPTCRATHRAAQSSQQCWHVVQQGKAHLKASGPPGICSTTVSHLAWLFGQKAPVTPAPLSQVYSLPGWQGAPCSKGGWQPVGPCWVSEHGAKRQTRNKESDGGCSAQPTQHVLPGWSGDATAI